ncbi:MAG: PadR family transcriptional regulator, partial [Planctomycetota bacterium]
KGRKMKLDNWQTQLRKGLLDFVALNLLGHGRSHGYEMVRTLKRIRRLKISEGSIYPILARLQADGLVTSFVATSPDGPPRRYFRLTELGQETLSSMNAYWDEVIESISGIRGGAHKCSQKKKRVTSSKPDTCAKWKKSSRQSKAPV